MMQLTKEQIQNYNDNGFVLLPTLRIVNILVCLDDMNEFNGPLFFIPGSHREGMIDVMAQKTSNQSQAEEERPAWMSNFTAKLKYSLNQ